MFCEQSQELIEAAAVCQVLNLNVALKERRRQVPSQEEIRIEDCPQALGISKSHLICIDLNVHRLQAALLEKRGALCFQGSATHAAFNLVQPDAISIEKHVAVHIRQSREETLAAERRVRQMCKTTKVRHLRRSCKPYLDIDRSGGGPIHCGKQCQIRFAADIEAERRLLGESNRPGHVYLGFFAGEGDTGQRQSIEIEIERERLRRF